MHVARLTPDDPPLNGPPSRQSYLINEVGEQHLMASTDVADNAVPSTRHCLDVRLDHIVNVREVPGLPDIAVDVHRGTRQSISDEPVDDHVRPLTRAVHREVSQSGTRMPKVWP